VTAEPFHVRCGGETQQGESEDASRRDVSLKPEEAADDSIAQSAISPPTGFRARAAGEHFRNHENLTDLPNIALHIFIESIGKFSNTSL
jgi:hypothetical protein